MTGAIRPMALEYVLITPARNEAGLIEQTIRSVIAQTVRPKKWIIVSDGSTDGTDEIVQRYAVEYPWIELLRMPERRDRTFAAKANAFNSGYGRLQGSEFDIIGNLYADITFQPDFYEFLLQKFASMPDLGVAGTPFVEDPTAPDRHTYAHRFADLRHVSGACQTFRRKCFEVVGGYVPIKGGAIDWIAVTTARMKGWKTQTFPEKICFHHRKIGTGNNSPLAVHFHYGKKAHFVGGHPLWVLFRGFFLMRSKPWIVGGILFQLGYFWSLIARNPRAVSDELLAFHRAEQMSRLKSVFAMCTSGKRCDDGTN